MKVFITGCARSGTTMMLYLMKYFFDTEVFTDQEYSPIDMQFNHYGKRIVFKKPQLQMSYKDYVPLEYALQKCHVIYMIRNPLDILVSKHGNVDYYVHPERLIDSYLEMLKNISHKNMQLIRYETLVSDPGHVMDLISKFLHASYSGDFENFHEHMVDPQMITGIKPRPIDTNSIDNWKKEEHHEYIDSLFLGEYGRKISSLLLALGYKHD